MSQQTPDKNGRSIVEQHRRHIELSPGVGADVQKYALAVCDDISADLDRLDREYPVRMTQEVYEEFLWHRAEALLRKSSPVSATEEPEGYPGIAHDLETLRAALQDARDALYNGFGQRQVATIYKSRVPAVPGYARRSREVNVYPPQRKAMVRHGFVGPVLY